MKLIRGIIEKEVYIMKIDSYFLSRFEEKFDKILYLLSAILKENKHMSAQMDELVAAVNDQKNVVDGVVVALEGFNARLDAINVKLAEAIDLAHLNDAAAADLVAVNTEAVTLHDEIEAETARLAAAVANVPTPPVA
jgi:hypothetical protein